MRLAALLALTLAPATTLAAEVTSAGPDAATLVIYRDANGERATEDSGDGVALVIEARTVDLPAGRSTIRFRGVADTMVPQTAALDGLPGTVEERNFDYDLLSPGALVAKAVGQRVRLVRTLPGSGRREERTGVIRSAPEGVLMETEEGIEAFKCSGLPEQMVFDQAPPGLSDRPTLSVQADVPKAGRYAVRLSYLAVSFNWSADYVATLAPDGTHLQLHGWLTLANRTGTSFAVAPTQVVAGTLSRSDDTEPVDVKAQRLRANCWPAATWPELLRSVIAAAPPPPPLSAPAPWMERAMVEEMVVTGSRVTAAQSDLGDLKLYSLPEPTAVAANQIKQVAFLADTTVAFDRVYRFRGDLFDEESEPDVEPEGQLLFRFQNQAANGLGVALPSGQVTVMQARREAGPLFVGEHEVRDTPVGLPVELVMGDSLEVQVTPVVAAREVGPRRQWDKTLHFRNTRTTPVEVEVREAAVRDGFRLVSEDRPHTNRASDLVWSLALAPGETQALHYAIEAED